MADSNKFEYVLITPARNEEAFIEKTVLSVISQTVLPKKWIVVSDGSTDRTDHIVRQYLKGNPYIELVRLDSEPGRNFGSKVNAFNVGYQHAGDLEHQFIGNLDADVSFQSDYYECVIKKFHRNSRLGLAGGEIYEPYNGKLQKYNSSLWHLSGAIHLFRKSCFKEIGGYMALKYGCIDAVAVIMTRMYGWEVEKDDSLKVIHHRRHGTAKGILYTKYNYGRTEYVIGRHPLYEYVKCIKRMREKPYVLAGLARLCGYIMANITREQLFFPKEVSKYLRQEDLKRIADMLWPLKKRSRIEDVEID
jgi:biofilm PGA synthesis N-glycosyltransferase PgaC